VLVIYVISCSEFNGKDNSINLVNKYVWELEKFSDENLVNCLITLH
jgi:hypothetical protein